MALLDINDYPIAEESFNLRDLLQRVLDTVGTLYAAREIPLPTRQYWTMERPVEDCEQVVVWFLQMYLGAPGDQASVPQRCGGIRSAVINVDITRQYPIGENGKAVSPERILKAGQWSAVDTQTLMDGLMAFDSSGEGSAGPGVIATVQAQEPMGGMQTIRLNLTIAVL